MAGQRVAHPPQPPIMCVPGVASNLFSCFVAMDPAEGYGTVVQGVDALLRHSVVDQ